MIMIFGKKKNVHPEILLDAEKVDSVIDETPEFIETQEPETALKVNTEVTPKSKSSLGSSLTGSRRVRAIKTSTMEKLRQDKKAYFDAKLELEREKLQELKHRNALIAERNEILKNFKCNCQFNSIL